ncbi:hypothetical protein [Paracraurococcus lichenis]|uniref:Uncharacterized protein n=1 Tax=Paracraurococcus lichenis TaxID=3064888 RepID=A0ABT9E8V1_9PROT|nr:hypothetical protein [Paracraurococcus sp. LOR1-02]MDO9712365.1 hypothetical protein [Paracraurococcus sp. LOR1-02]
MATEHDLKVARAEFDEAFSKAVLHALAPQLIELQQTTLYDLDELPVAAQILRLQAVAVQFRDFAAGRIKLVDLQPQP